MSPPIFATGEKKPEKNLEPLEHLFYQKQQSLLYNGRLISYSATLIDNIFTNDISSDPDNRLIVNDLSDHVTIEVVQLLASFRRAKITSFILSSISFMGMIEPDDDKNDLAPRLPMCGSR